MRSFAIILAASALAITATAATAAPSVTGISGCVLKQGNTVSQSTSSSSTSSVHSGGRGDSYETTSGYSKTAVPCQNAATVTYQETRTSSGGGGKNPSKRTTDVTVENMYQYGSYVTASEINYAFQLIEQETIKEIERQVNANKTKFTVNSPDPVVNANNPDSGIFKGTATVFSGAIMQKEKTTVKNGGLDLTSLQSAFR